jgi:hypothetical protein
MVWGCGVMGMGGNEFYAGDRWPQKRTMGAQKNQTMRGGARCGGRIVAVQDLWWRYFTRFSRPVWMMGCTRGSRGRGIGITISVRLEPWDRMGYGGRGILEMGWGSVTFFCFSAADDTFFVWGYNMVEVRSARTWVIDPGRSASDRPSVRMEKIAPLTPVKKFLLTLGYCRAFAIYRQIGTALKKLRERIRKEGHHGHSPRAFRPSSSDDISSLALTSPPLA